MIKAKALRVCAKGWVRGGIQNNLKVIWLLNK